jgi:hypothetical protein
MLPLLSSPFYAFFLSSILSLRSRFLSDARVLLKYLMCPHMSRYHNHCEAGASRDRPCHHLGLNTRSSRSYGLNPLRWWLPGALGPSSPTSFYPCRLARPSPDTLCVFRHPLEGQRRRPHLHDGVLSRPCTTTGYLHQHPLQGMIP